MKLKRLLLEITTAAALLLVPVLTTAPAAYAASIQDSLCHGANQLQISSEGAGDCSADAGGTTDKVNTTISQFINIFSTLVGVIAVIMIIYGGLRYITSGGDSTKITNAKNTIIYALIGLVVVALAQFIVKFVLNKVTTS